METCLNWCGDKALISTDDRGLISKLLRGIERYPEECKIIAMPETNDGCLYFSCPVEFGKHALRNLFPSGRKLNDAQRAAAAERLKAARARRGGETE